MMLIAPAFSPWPKFPRNKVYLVCFLMDLSFAILVSCEFWMSSMFNNKIVQQIIIPLVYEFDLEQNRFHTRHNLMGLYAHLGKTSWMVTM